MQLVFALLLPCLIFAELGKSITLQKMLEWLDFLPISFLFFSLLSSFLNLMVVLALNFVDYFNLRDFVCSALSQVVHPIQCCSCYNFRFTHRPVGRQHSPASIPLV